jgi:hypothetical protein
LKGGDKQHQLSALFALAFASTVVLHSSGVNIDFPRGLIRFAWQGTVAPERPLARLEHTGPAAMPLECQIRPFAAFA